MKVHGLNFHHVLRCGVLAVAGMSAEPLYTTSEANLRRSANLQVRPIFPHSMSVLPTYRRVVVGVTINEYGAPIDVKIIESAGREFDNPVILAVRKWRFEPYIGALGKPVRLYGKLTFYSWKGRALSPYEMSAEQVGSHVMFKGRK